ncbi:MAG: hypothetical protein AAGI15_11970 [Pseudomonadota bacterium]
MAKSVPKAIQRGLLAILILLLLAAVGILLSPITPIPGGAMSGETVTAAVADWSFAKSARFAQLETQVPAPRTITVRCIVAGGQLYVGCSRCAGRRWSAQLEAQPAARYRVNGTIYPVTATKVTDPEELARVWLVRAAGTGDDHPGPKPDDIWFFRLDSR